MEEREFCCDCNIIHEEIVQDAKDKMLKDEMLGGVVDFFKILGDSTRIKILFVLDHNEMCVCDIANVLNMTKSSISHQLSTLRLNGIVKCRREGKEVYYMLDDDHVTQLYEMGLRHIIHQIQNGKSEIIA